MNLEEKQISSEEIFNGVAIHLFRDEILLPNGKKSVREVIRHPGAVCVLPLTEQGEIIFVNQFRYALGKVTLEVPAGKLEKGEDPMVAAMRELSEETGLDAKNVVPMGELYTTPALIDEIIYMYIATDLYQGEKHPDEDEFLEIVRIPLSELVEDVLSGRIPDSKTQCAVLKADAYLKRKNV
jgi:ADP-ribose pyrophosphatase